MAPFHATATAPAKKALPPVSPTEYHNTLLTLGLAQRPFDPNLYGAMMGVIQFRSLNIATRQSLILAIGNAANAPRQSPSLSPQASTFRQLAQLRLLAYGTGIDDWSICHNTEIVNYPWALTDAEFRAAYRRVAGDNEPSDKPFDANPASTATTATGDWLRGTAKSHGWKYVKALLLAYGPRLVSKVITGSEGGPWGLILGAVMAVSEALLTAAGQSAKLQDLQQRYETERVRRGIHAQ